MGYLRGRVRGFVVELSRHVCLEMESGGFWCWVRRTEVDGLVRESWSGWFGWFGESGGKGRVDGGGVRFLG